MMTSFAGYIGLEKTFRRAVEAVGLGDSVVRLKGIQTGPRTSLDGCNIFGQVTGSPEHILQAWNTACAATLEINKAALPFTPVGPNRTGPMNCHSGTRAVLRTMGDEFSAIADLMGDQKTQRPSRDLHNELPALRAKLPGPADIRTISVESLLEAQQALAANLYETSRKLKNTKAQSVTAAPAAPSSAGGSLPTPG